MPLVLWLLSIAPLSLPTSDTPNQYEILEHIKLNVEIQLAKYANYTCIQTVERTYYEQRHACAVNQPHGKPHVFMRDRLRLDVAVSEGKEIYSWHGENKFTSANITHVIPTGPRTSGQFTGFLRNIFLTQGTQFKFKGPVNINGRPAYAFDYAVQLLRSTYLIEGQSHGGVVPFHGVFAVDAETLELMRLSVAADEIPLATGMCSATTELDYQMVDISGRRSLLPASYVMKVESINDLYTVNRNEYSQCREFRGESTLIFTPVNPVQSAATRRAVNQQLPPGLVLQGSLDDQIDDKSSYEGDAVLATLSEPIALSDGKTVIPKGAKLHGVISKLEEHEEGLQYWLLGIKIERIENGEDSYLVNAWPIPQSVRTQAPGGASPRVGGRSRFGGAGSSFGSDAVLQQQSQEAARHGDWFMDGSHFKLAKHSTRAWKSFGQSAGPAE